jgi:hypothetical protein
LTGITRLRADNGNQKYGGYRVLPGLSVGAEARYFSDTGYSEIQTGGLLRANTSWGELSIDAGEERPRTGESGHYGGIGLLERF